MIREARHADIPRLVDLGQRFMVESGYSRHLTVNRKAQADLARMLIESPAGLVLIEERGGRALGMIGVIATLHPHSGERVMSELFWYVAPESRGGGVRLLLRAEGWARANGVAKSLVIAPNARVGAFYVRMGYAHLETQFIKDL